MFENVNNFSDFMKVFRTKKAVEKGRAFEQLVKYIFKYHPNYANEFNEVYLYNEVPSHILDDLNLPLRDYGIDLILVDNEYNYHAVQAKYRTNKKLPIRWDELSTFFALADSVSTQIQNKYVVTNTISINKISARCKNAIFIYGEFFNNDGMKTVFDKIKLHKEIKIDTNKIEPRKYQQEIINNVVNHFNVIDNNRCYISVACGAGKTAITYWINNKLKSKKTIIAVPSLQLSNQIFSEWKNLMYNDEIKIPMLIVGSDSEPNITGVVYNTYVLNGTYNTTNLDDILCFMKTNDTFILITTYQSSDLIIEAFKNNFADLCIFDEAHKTVGDKKKQFARLIFNENINIHKRLFVTATSKIFKQLSNKTNDELLSMDNIDYYGSKQGEYQITAAINDKYLCDYQLNTFIINDENIFNLIANNNLVNFGNIYTSEYMACAIILIEQFKIYKNNLNNNNIDNNDNYIDNGITHPVTYHNTIEECKQFAALLQDLANNQNLEIKISSLNGNESMKQRVKIINEFEKSEMAVLCNAKVLNEGVNIPIIDSIMFVKPRKSVIDIVQCVGRALRLYKNKKLVKIIIPLINITDDMIKDSFNNNKKETVLTNMINILRSLAMYDTGIQDYFDCIQNGKSINRQIIKNNYNFTNNEQLSQTIEIEKWLAELQLNIVNKYNIWNMVYNKFVEFVNENNKLPNKRSKDQIECALGRWVGTQKNEYKTLPNFPDNKKNKLEAINLWTWESHNEKWMTNYDNLLKFMKTSNKLPSRSSSDNDEKALGEWRKRQRDANRFKKLKQHKFDMLNVIPGWKWESDKYDWYIRYDELVKFYNDYNKNPSRISTDETEGQLAGWISTQRTLFTGKDKKMTQEKIDKLTSLKLWEWAKSKEERWDTNYNNLLKFVSDNGRMPKHKEKDTGFEEETRLAKWRDKQKEYKKTGKLNDNDLILKLENIKGWTWIEPIDPNKKENEWLDDYNKCMSFLIKNKRRHNKRYADEQKSGEWLGRQIKEKNKGILKSNKMALINEFIEMEKKIKKEINDLKLINKKL